MEAVYFTRYGEWTAVVEIGFVPKPFPSKGEVCIQVHAVSLNPQDKTRIQGAMAVFDGTDKVFPVPVGTDVAGIVAAVGEGVTEYKIGDAVVAYTPPDFCVEKRQGALAQFCLAPIASVSKKPESVSFEDAAAVPFAGMTALQALQRGKVHSGDDILITGGGGGVGTFAIQLAKHAFMCHSVSTTASGEKVEVCKEIGADVVINYKEETLEDHIKPHSMWAAIDISNEAARLAPLVARGGTVVSITATPLSDDYEEVGKKVSRIAKTQLFAKRNTAALKAAKDCGNEFCGHVVVPKAEDLGTLLEMVVAGVIKPVVKVFEWKDWKAAMELAFGGHALGKVVVRVVA